MSATATAQQATVVCTEEERRRLIELRERLLSQAPIGLPNHGEWAVSYERQAWLADDER